MRSYIQMLYIYLEKNPNVIKLLNRSPDQLIRSVHKITLGSYYNYTKIINLLIIFMMYNILFFQTYFLSLFF